MNICPTSASISKSHQPENPHCQSGHLQGQPPTRSAPSLKILAHLPVERLCVVERGEKNNKAGHHQRVVLQRHVANIYWHNRGSRSDNIVLSQSPDVQIPESASYDWPANVNWLAVSPEWMFVQRHYDMKPLFQWKAEKNIMIWRRSAWNVNYLSRVPLGFIFCHLDCGVFIFWSSHVYSHNTNQDQLWTHEVPNGPLVLPSFWRVNKFQSQKIEKETIRAEIEDGSKKPWVWISATGHLFGVAFFVSKVDL